MSTTGNSPPDGALVLIGARGGVGAPGTTHQASPPPQKPFLANRRMHDQIRPVAGAVRPPARVSCLSWSLDGQVPAFLFLPYEQSTAELRVPWEQFHSSIGHPRLSDASTCIVVLSTTTTGLLKRNF